ncbi:MULTISPECIES: hypothetical protein [unclassified Bradyrhizobium]
MHDIVCIKQLFDFAQVRVRPSPTTPCTSGRPTIVNPHDLFALRAVPELTEEFGGELTSSLWRSRCRRI